MNKDNIQELLKPRYLVSTPWYPTNNYQSGDIVTPDKFTGWHPKYSPVIFRRLDWREYRDVKDMPEYVKYVKHGCSHPVGSVCKVIRWGIFERGLVEYGNEGQPYAVIEIKETTKTHDVGEEVNVNAINLMPATKLEYDEYLNQTNQP